MWLYLKDLVFPVYYGCYGTLHKATTGRGRAILARGLTRGSSRVHLEGVRGVPNIQHSPPPSPSVRIIAEIDLEAAAPPRCGSWILKYLGSRFSRIPTRVHNNSVCEVHRYSAGGSG